MHWSLWGLYTLKEERDGWINGWWEKKTAPVKGRMIKREGRLPHLEV